MVATWPLPSSLSRSIKVTPQDRQGGRRSEWSESFFSNLKQKNQKWTFINVHFPKKVFRFEKNIDFVTQSIMLTFTFLSWFFCYDNFFSKNLKIYIWVRDRRFCLQKNVQKRRVFFSAKTVTVNAVKKWFQLMCRHTKARKVYKSLQKFTKKCHS